MGTEVVVRSVAVVEPLSGKIRYLVPDDESREYTTKTRETQDGTNPDEEPRSTAVDAAPWMLGTREPNEEILPKERFEKPEPFKRPVVDDIRDGKHSLED